MSLVTISNILKGKKYQCSDLQNIIMDDCLALNKMMRKMEPQLKIEKLKMYVFYSREKISLDSLFKTFPYLVDFELRSRVSGGLNDNVDNGRVIFGFKKLSDYSTVQEITMEYRYIDEALKFPLHSINKIRIYLNDYVSKNYTTIRSNKIINFLKNAKQDTIVEIVLNFSSSEWLLPKFPSLDADSLIQYESEFDLKFKNLVIAVEVDHQRVINWKFLSKKKEAPNFSSSSPIKFRWKGMRTRFNNYIVQHKYNELISFQSNISSTMIQSALMYLTKFLCGINCQKRDFEKSRCPLHYTLIDERVIESWNIENFRENLRKRIRPRDGHLVLTYDNASNFNALFSKNIAFVSSSSSSSFQFDNVFEIILKNYFPSRVDELNTNSSSIIARTFPNLKRLDLVGRHFLFPDIYFKKIPDYSFENLIEIKIDSLTEHYGIFDHTPNLKILKLCFNPKKIDASGLFQILSFNQFLERIELNINYKYKGFYWLFLKNYRESENKNINLKEIIINMTNFAGNHLFQWRLKASNEQTEESNGEALHFLKESEFLKYLQNSHDQTQKTFNIDFLENFDNFRFLKNFLKSLQKNLNNRKKKTCRRKRKRKNNQIISKNKRARISDKWNYINPGNINKYNR